jgi:hypothetical protein
MPKRHARKSSDGESVSRREVIPKGASRLARQRAAKASAERYPRARQQSRQKVAAPGKKHRRAPEILRGVKHSDERISKAMTTRRRRSGRPREG